MAFKRIDEADQKVIIIWMCVYDVREKINTPNTNYKDAMVCN